MKPHFKTIGEIMITNTLVATENTSAYTAAVRLLETSFQGLLVLDRSGNHDILRAWLGFWVEYERGSSYAQVMG
jgi:CBS domain-containing protein